MGELIEAMRFLVERREWRGVLARNARREVLEKYQWSHHVEMIISGIEALAEASEGHRVHGACGR
jgi:glycosyltransferase involved in cell wall biosynthesis